MANLLQTLTDDAVGLIESELPAPALVRSILGGLIKHVDALEQHVFGTPAPAAPAAAAPTVSSTVSDAVSSTSTPAATAAQTVTPAPTPLQELQSETDKLIAELETRLAALRGAA